MSKRRIARLGSLFSVAVATAAACYGSGPEPTGPSSATVLWAPLQPGAGSCAQSSYVGPVAFGASTGYAITMPYASGTCFSTTRDLSITSFPLSGGDAMGSTVPQGDSGMVTADTTGGFGSKPRLAASGGAVAVVYIDNQPTIGPAQSTFGLYDGSATPPGFSLPAAISLDATALYVAIPVESPSTTGDPFSPQFPYPGQSISDPSPNVLWRVDWPPPAKADATLHWVADSTLSCGELDQCVVANSTTLFHVGLAPDGNSVAGIYAIPKAGGLLPVPIATVPTGSVDARAVPVGLAADDTHVVLVMANPPDRSRNGEITPGCSVFAHDLTAAPGPATQVFSSDKVSCMGAAIDAAHAYFAVVRNGDLPCETCSLPLHGDGIGRVALDASNDFESVAFEMRGGFDGPRRVYITYPGTMFVVAPSAIASVPTDALADQHDLGQ